MTGVGALIAAATSIRNGRKIAEGTKATTATAAKAADVAALAVVTADAAKTSIEAVHQEIKSPNGHTTGQTVQHLADKLGEVDAKVEDIAKESASLSVAVGSHLADGHGGKR